MLAGTTSCSTDLKNDRDGQTYKTIKINNRTWMAENLRYGGTKHFSANQDKNNDAIYRYLYPWENAKRACPKDWRLPTKEEFEDLLTATGSGENESSSIRNNKWDNGIPRLQPHHRFRPLPQGLKFLTSPLAPSPIGEGELFHKNFKIIPPTYKNHSTI